jgi:hypothetical protein
LKSLSGKIFPLLYGVIAGIFAPFALLGGIFGEGGMVAGVIMVVMLIVFYPIMGFVGGVISAAIYDFAAGLIGGLEITLEQVGE